MLESLQGSATRDLFKHCSLVLGVSNQSTQCWGCTFILLSTDMELSVSIEEVITCLSNTALYYLFTVPQGNSCGFQKICVNSGMCDAVCQPLAFSCTVYTVVAICTDVSGQVYSRLGLVRFVNVFFFSLSCSPRLNLFDQKYSKKKKYYFEAFQFKILILCSKNIYRSV